MEERKQLRDKRFSFCPLCAGFLETKTRSLSVCSSCGFRFYQGSKPTAGALILRESPDNPFEKEVLLVKRRFDPFAGMWDVPGGFLENGEDPEAGVRREIEEELGIELVSASLFRAFPDTYPREDIPEESSHLLALYYICSIGEAPLRAMDDIAGFAWFPVRSLPDGIAFEGNRKALLALKQHITGEG
jgi:ADP-ribose pyrophosphatase YjhB (NUDIX family)